MSEGEFKRRMDKIAFLYTTERLKAEQILDDVRKEFYDVWNEAYGSASQQGLDIYNKWFLKWFRKEKAKP